LSLRVRQGGREDFFRPFSLSFSLVPSISPPVPTTSGDGPIVGGFGILYSSVKRNTREKRGVEKREERETAMCGRSLS
jgi:hypothetical protein